MRIARIKISKSDLLKYAKEGDTIYLNKYVKPTASRNKLINKLIKIVVKCLQH